MLQYKRIYVSEGIDINKSNKSKEYMICHYWYFKDIGYKFEPYVCNSCHNTLMVAYELQKWNMIKNYVINMLSNFKLDDKGTL